MDDESIQPSDGGVKFCVACHEKIPTLARKCRLCGENQAHFEQQLAHDAALADGQNERVVFVARPAVFYDVTQYLSILFFFILGLILFLDVFGWEDFFSQPHHFSLLNLSPGLNQGSSSEAVWFNTDGQWLSVYRLVRLVLFVGLVVGSIVRPFYQSYATKYTLTNQRLTLTRGLFYPLSIPIDHSRVSEVAEYEPWSMKVLGFTTIRVSAPTEKEISLIEIHGVRNVLDWKREILHFLPVQREIQKIYGFRAS